MFHRQLLWIVAIACLPQSANPVERRSEPQEIVDFAPPPSTFRELLKQADVVIEGHVKKAGTPTVDLVPANPQFHTPPKRFVRRYHDVVVDDVLLSRTPAIREGGSIVVRQAGGSAMAGTEEVSTSYSARPLKTGDRVVLFLRSVLGSPSIFEPMYGANGILWEQADGTIELPKGWRMMPEIGTADSISSKAVKELVKQHAPVSRQ